MVEKKEQKMEELRRKEQEMNKWENNIVIKQIPDYQKEWEVFDRKQREKKEEYRQKREQKYNETEVFRFNGERGERGRGINEEMDRVNEQKR